MNKRLIFCITALLFIFFSCKKNTDFSSDSSLRLEFSTDTVAFDTVFTEIGSSTHKLMIYNKNNKSLKIKSIYLRGGSASPFKINLDGVSGSQFYDKEIYDNDSLYTFIKATINPNDQNNPFLIEDELVFNYNDNEQVVHLTAYGQNANYIIADKYTQGFPKYKIVADSLTVTHWTSEKPYVIYGYALIDSYGTLVIDPGTRVYIHDNSGIWAYSKGQLVIDGTLENPVIIQGDRLEHFYDDEPGQWDRIWLMEAREDHGHSINHAIIRNAFIGVQTERFIENNEDIATIKNTVIENVTGMGIYSNCYNLRAENLLVDNCGSYSVAITGGGYYTFIHSTLANYWSNSPRTTPSLFFNNVYLNPSDGMNYAVDFKFEMDNSIMYGALDDEIETDFQPGTDTTYIFNNCLLKTKRALDETHYINCIKNKDPKFVNYNAFDCHLDTLSPAIGIGNPAYSTGELQYDLDGVQRGESPDCGAYQYKKRATIF